MHEDVWWEPRWMTIRGWELDASYCNLAGPSQHDFIFILTRGYNPAKSASNCLTPTIHRDLSLTCLLCQYSNDSITHYHSLVILFMTWRQLEENRAIEFGTPNNPQLGRWVARHWMHALDCRDQALNPTNNYSWSYIYNLLAFCLA